MSPFRLPNRIGAAVLVASLIVTLYDLVWN
jgi:hypothetical protein